MNTWIEFGSIGRPHGVRGELTLWPENLASDNGQVIKNVVISKDNDPQHGQSYKVLAIKEQKDHWLLTLEGLTSREAAALLTGSRLFVDRGELTPCKDNEIYLSDILNYQICDGDKVIGQFTATVDYPQGVYLLVTCKEGDKEGELELPWVTEYIDNIDDSAKKVYCHFPEGLLELIQWK